MIAPDRFMRSTARVPEHVVFRSFDAETVVLNLRTGAYHGVDPAGGRLLELLDENGGAVGPAVERLAAEHGAAPAEVAAGLAEFCAELAERDLIEIDAPGDG